MIYRQTSVANFRQGLDFVSYQSVTYIHIHIRLLNFYGEI